MKALDVATGGGHVARRLREAGADVVSADRAPGMNPDVVCPAEDLPFENESFDVVAVRIAPHHFEDVQAAVREMARVSRDRVVIQDTLFESEELERIYSLRDPSHVRCYSEDEWRDLLRRAELRIETTQIFEKRRPFEAWIECTAVPSEDADELRALLAAHLDENDEWADRHIVIKARKA
ncbi:MAG TPA: class I SAM-dependent methyltransferase [Thermoanaerobaculia bacterium]|nr:class I SAM-dependent methyltransferase [Thermoanaerobaculia bacterium]